MTNTHAYVAVATHQSAGSKEPPGTTPNQAPAPHPDNATDVRPQLAASKEPPDDSKDNTPSLNPAEEYPELFHHNLNLRSNEHTLNVFNAVQSGTATGSWPLFLLYFANSPVDEVGFGVNLSSGAAIGGITAASVASIPVIIAAAYIAYDEWSDAKSHIEYIQGLETLRRKNREDLLVEALRLRCLYQNEAEYLQLMHQLALQNAEVDEVELATLANQIYKSDEFKKHPFNIAADHLITPDEKTAQPKTLYDIFCNTAQSANVNTRESAIQYLHQKRPQFNDELRKCFKPITLNPVTSWKPALYGAAYGSMLFGSALNTVWTLPGLLIGAGICASIPLAGWIILLAASVVASIYFAKKIYDMKYKNLQRADLATQLEERNSVLVSTKENLNNHYTTRCLELHEQEEQAKKTKELNTATTHAKEIKEEQDARKQAEAENAELRAEVQRLRSMPAIPDKHLLSSQHLLSPRQSQVSANAPTLDKASIALTCA